MRRLLTTTSRAAVCAMLFAAAATPVHAQLGKLKKMASDAAKDAAAGKKPETPDGSSGARVDYTVTADRLAAIMSVLGPRVAEAKKESDARQAMADYNAKQKTVTDCYNKTSASGLTPDVMAVSTEKGQAITARSAAITQRLTTVMQTKNYRAQIALQDTAVNVQMQMAALMYPGLKCGPLPYKSAAIIDAEVRRMESAANPASYNSNSDEIVVPADKRGGMTPGQFGRVREIIAIWLLMQSGDLPANSRKFTDEETAALNAKAAELKTYTPLFKDGAMRWATWGDIKSW